MTTPFSLLEGNFYIDERAAAKYASQAGDEIVMRQQIWLAGTEREVTPGEGRGYVNHTRVVAGVGVEEQIISAGLPSESDKAGAVPTIQYKMTTFGAMPVDDHLGFVAFVPQESASHTEIVWLGKLKLKAEGSPPFTDPKALPPFLHGAISGLLAAFSTAVDAEK